MCKTIVSARILVTLSAVLLAAAPLLGKEFEEQFSLKSDDLVLINLIGEITVEQADGATFEVIVAVRGDDASREHVQIETNEGHKAMVVVKFPIENTRSYVYPKLGRGSKTTITMRNDMGEQDSWLARLFSGMGQTKIKVSGSGSGLEVWADVTIKVPAGKRCQVKHGVGEITASDVKGDLFLEIHSGPVTAYGIEGSLLADSGSGAVKVEHAKGDLTVDTGSGSVVLNQCSGKKISVDTGSGSVKVEGIECKLLNIDTGSGGVRALAVEADDAKIDTGSGSVKLLLDRMGDGRFVLDTGSGSVELGLPRNASAEVTAETGSGGISVDLKGVSLEKAHKDYVRFTLGSGDARVNLDTGSGGIRIYYH